MDKIIGTIFIAPLLLANMQATPAPKQTPPPAKQATPPVPAKPSAATPVKTDTSSVKKDDAKTTVSDPADKQDIPVITLKKPGEPSTLPVTVKAGETAEQYATRTGTNPDVLCFMTLGTFSAVAGQNAKDRNEEDRKFLSRVDAATDFFMGRTTATLAAPAIEPAMKKAGALITSATLGSLSTPCLVYYDKAFAPIAAQIRPGPSPAPAAK